MAWGEGKGVKTTGCVEFSYNCIVLCFYVVSSEQFVLTSNSQILDKIEEFTKTMVAGPTQKLECRLAGLTHVYNYICLRAVCYQTATEGCQFVSLVLACDSSNNY